MAGVIAHRRNGVGCALFDASIRWRAQTRIDSARRLTLGAFGKIRPRRPAGVDPYQWDASGTAGITGAFDFVLVLHRVRHAAEASISVTGRDVAEGEYALKTDGGLWSLDGTTLAEAADIAKRRREHGKLGDRSLDVVTLVSQRGETRAADLKSIGIDQEQGRVYLNRLAEAGRIQKTGRGQYKPVTSVTTVTDTTEDVTHITDVTLFETKET